MVGKAEVCGIAAIIATLTIAIAGGLHIKTRIDESFSWVHEEGQGHLAESDRSLAEINESLDRINSILDDLEERDGRTY
jgi:hypothetical protein